MGRASKGIFLGRSCFYPDLCLLAQFDVKAFHITIFYDLSLILIAAVMLKALIISVALIITSIMLFNFSMSYVNAFNYVLIAFIH